MTKSILEGKTKLRWLFREENGVGNGWGRLQTSNARKRIWTTGNLTVVDFNMLANIEPAVLNVFSCRRGQTWV